MAETILSDEEFLALPDEGVTTPAASPVAASLVMSDEDFLALPDEGEVPATPAVVPAAPPPITGIELAPTPQYVGPPSGGSLAPLPTDPTQNKPMMKWIKEDSPFGPGGTLGPNTLLSTGLGGLGFAVAGPPGALVGSTLGAMGGKTVEKFWENSDEVKEERSLSKDVQDVMWEGAKELMFAQVPLTHAIERAGSKVLNKAVFKHVDDVTKATAEIAARRGMRQTVAEETGSPTAAKLESVPERVPLLTKPAREYQKGVIADARREVSSAIQRLDPDYNMLAEEVGKASMMNSKRRYQAAKDWSSRKFQQLSRFVNPDLEFPTTQVYREVQNIVKEEARNRGVKVEDTLRTRALLPGESAIADEQIGGRVIAKIKEFHLHEPEAGKMNFDRLRGVQMEFGELADKYAGTPEGRQYARVASKIGKDLDAFAATPHGAGLKPELEKAKEYHRMNVVQRFKENPAYQKIQSADASQLVDTIFPKGVSVEEVRRVKSVLSPKEFKRLRAGVFNKLIGVDPDNLGSFSGADFIYRMGNEYWTPQVRKELLGDDAFKDMEEIRRVLAQREKMSRRGGNDLVTAGSTGTQIGQMVKGGLGVLGVGSGGYLAASGFPLTTATLGLVSAFTPGAIAQLMHSPTGRKFLLEGLNPPAWVRKGVKGTLYGAAKLPLAIARSRADWPLEEDKEPTGPAGLPVGEVMTPQTPIAVAPSTGVPIEMQQAFGGVRGGSSTYQRPGAPGMNLRPDPKFAP